MMVDTKAERVSAPVPVRFPAAAPWAAETLGLIEAAIHERALVYGSLPPEGGDLDILARPAAFTAIERALLGVGFLPIREVFVRFVAGQCQMVELTLATAWGLAPAEVEALFAQARPLIGDMGDTGDAAGPCRLARPSPQHALLIQARKLPRRGALTPMWRERIAALAAEQPDVWREAQRHAGAWRARVALTLLHDAMEGREDARRLSRFARWRTLAEQLGGDHTLPLEPQLRAAWALLPRLRRTRVITFSGLDGSGKSTQAALLCAALRSAGQDAHVIWAGIGANQSLTRIKKPVKGLVRALPHAGPFAELTERFTPSRDGGQGLSLAEPGRRGQRHSVGYLGATQLWMVILALANVYTTRRALLLRSGRGRVIIFDRYTLDSAVRLCHWYGDSPAARLTPWLIHLLAKRPLRAYLLDAQPQVVFDRKPEWTLDDLTCRSAFYHEWYAPLGVRRLDATRPCDDLASEIAADVWRALR